MKIVAATWERRNLGLDVTEITLDRPDLENESETLEVLRKYMIPRHYLLVKAPAGAIAFLAKLQALGFIFLECQYNISKNIRDYVAPPLFLRFVDRVSSELLSEDEAEWLNLCRSIGDTMFTTDRVALDPMFGVGTANKRYRNWLMDMRKDRTASAYRIICDGENIGFNAISFETETLTARSVLGGIFKDCQGKGLGGAMIHAPIVFSAAKGMRLYSTAISSNNQAVFRLYLLFGFNIDSSSYVFRYCPDEN
ncbi:MAG: GNAT family N-acetyltransferase [Synergistaceae bacterium]|jgi:hypothetical protein|nr:GNAT family N-acetyltransferase [Synergistaceae bacterium]